MHIRFQPLASMLEGPAAPSVQRATPHMATASILSNRTAVGPSSVWRRMEGSAGDPGGCLAIKTSLTVCVALSEEGSRSFRWSTTPFTLRRQKMD